MIPKCYLVERLREKTSLSAGGCYSNVTPNSLVEFIEKCMTISEEIYLLDLLSQREKPFGP